MEATVAAECLRTGEVDAIVARWRLTRHTALHAAVMLRAFPGLRISSGRRSAAYNRRVGGVPNSWHLVGRGVDFVGPLDVLRAAHAWVWYQRVTASCTGPEEVVWEHDHLHVAW